MALITLLVVTNVWGTGPGVRARHDGAAPSPADIPPQLPAQDQSVEATPAPTGGITSAPAGQPSAGGQPVPVPTVTVTETVTPRAAQDGGSGNRSGTGATSPPVGEPTTGGSGGIPTTGGGDPGSPPPLGQRFRVTDLRIVSDRANGSYVWCNGREQIPLIGTVLVDGVGPGDVVYQWVYDKARVFPPDILHFIGSGPRQLTLSFPWPIPSQLLGEVSGVVQLLILQPVANAQTERYTFDFRCRGPFSDD
ncbi:hypothetical protein [Embleya hyalina]|uniref:hypothetical protein n=1 Tax=Embleya hyalina TaxID=516124 RepID=UPI000F8454BF|nr:hypothetical protein [Embleya hyalina]